MSFEADQMISQRFAGEAGLPGHSVVRMQRAGSVGPATTKAAR